MAQEPKQIIEFPPGGAISGTDVMLLQQGPLGTPLTHIQLSALMQQPVPTLTATTGTFAGLLTAAGSGTGLSVTNNATIGGTLGVTGASSLAALSATTGTFSSTATATAFIPTSATIPSNGMYLPAANTLGFAANTTAEMQMTGTALSPATSDGLALGTTALMWSDVFLASGAVINFNNGDMTITHGSNVLTIAGGSLAVETMLMASLAAGASYDDDAAAASGGIAIGQMYRNGNFLMVRLT